MEDNSDIQKVFRLFKEKKFEEAQELNDKILQKDPTNMYAKKYAKVIFLELSKATSSKSQSGGKETIQKVRGKSLKCPHCEAKIPVSGMAQEQIKSLKDGNYNNLSIKCNYCHTDFVLQKRKADSILGIKLGDKANIMGKEYRTVGYVQYVGTWYEGRYSGKTAYLEWILLGKDNSYYYFSEGKSWDDGRPEFEFELSQKIIPKFTFTPNYSGKNISIEGSNVKFSGITKATVKSVYGENSKSYTIGEKNELFEFLYGGKSYVIEKEGSGNQTEAGIYENQSLSGSTASIMFGKKYSSSTIARQGGGGQKIGIMMIYGIIGVFCMGPILTLITATGGMGNPFNSLFEDKKAITIDEIVEGQKFELMYPSKDLIPQTTSSMKYDYGGTKTTTKSYTGLKFSIESEADKKLLKKIQELNNNEYGINEYSNTKTLENMFTGKIYQLK